MKTTKKNWQKKNWSLRDLCVVVTGLLHEFQELLERLPEKKKKKHAQKVEKILRACLATNDQMIVWKNVFKYFMCDTCIIFPWTLDIPWPNGIAACDPTSHFWATAVTVASAGLYCSELGEQLLRRRIRWLSQDGERIGSCIRVITTKMMLKDVWFAGHLMIPCADLGNEYYYQNSLYVTTPTMRECLKIRVLPRKWNAQDSGGLLLECWHGSGAPNFVTFLFFLNPVLRSQGSKGVATQERPRPLSLLLRLPQFLGVKSTYVPAGGQNWGHEPAIGVNGDHAFSTPWCHQISIHGDLSWNRPSSQLLSDLNKLSCHAMVLRSCTVYRSVVKISCQLLDTKYGLQLRQATPA